MTRQILLIMHKRLPHVCFCIFADILLFWGYQRSLVWCLKTPQLEAVWNGQTIITARLEPWGLRNASHNFQLTFHLLQLWKQETFLQTLQFPTSRRGILGYSEESGSAFSLPARHENFYIWETEIRIIILQILKYNIRFLKLWSVGLC